MNQVVEGSNSITFTCRLTQKRVRDMIITYSPLKSFCKNKKQTERTDRKIVPYLSHNQIKLKYNSFLRDSLAITLLFGHFILGVQITTVTNFKKEH